MTVVTTTLLIMPVESFWGTLGSEIRDHDGFNALVDNSFLVLIQPSCVFEDTHPHERRNRYVRLQITADRTEILKLDYLYSSTYLVTEQEKKSFIDSRGKDPEKTIIVSPHFHIKQDPKFLNDLVLNFPNSFLLPFRESSDKNQNPLQIDAKEDQANSEKFVEWRDWPKKIIDLPPGLEPRHPSRPCS
ncbi:hypothetical protein GG344DRAFT_63774 [Lentinula edodes]|nr:hypothetical protein GG344DRAFT_63774 [Lentinula edodes]